MGEIYRYETTAEGIFVEIDASAEACREFHFPSGSRVVVEINGKEKRAVVRGVAPNDKGQRVLWYALDDDGGKISFGGVKMRLTAK